MARRIRVLFPFVGDSVGGSHQSAIELIKAFENLSPNIETIISINRKEGPLAKHLETKELNHISLPEILPTLPKNGYLVQAITLLVLAIPYALLLRKNNIDIVHTNDKRMHFSWTFACKLAGAKHIWHQRSPAGRRHSLLWRYATRVLTISEYCRNALPKRMSDAAIVVDNPIELSLPDNSFAKSDYKEALIAELNLPDDAVLIGWVANWMARKRPEVFVEIADKMLTTSSRPIYFLMFGEPRGDAKEAIPKLIDEKGLKNRVIILGTKNPIQPYMAGLDVLVATAINEGLGRTIIEAMLVNTPVVASGSGGHKEIVIQESTGLLVEPNDIASFSECIERLVNEPNLTANLTKNAYMQAKDRYSVKRHVKSIEAIYQEVSNGVDKKQG